MAVGAAALLQHRWWSAPVAGLVLLTTARSVRRHLPTANDADDNTGVVALRLASRGLGWAVRQEGALLLRHWWPISVVAAAKSRQVRRALLASLVVELGVFLHERPGCDPATALIARRLDDLAYGGGLWWGAIRRREPRCLFVRWLPWSR